MRPDRRRDPVPVVLERRGPGRPPALEPGSSLSTWLPVSAHDQVIRLAQQSEISVSTYVRQIILIQLDKE